MNWLKRLLGQKKKEIATEMTIETLKSRGIEAAPELVREVLETTTQQQDRRGQAKIGLPYPEAWGVDAETARIIREGAVTDEHIKQGGWTEDRHPMPPGKTDGGYWRINAANPKAREAEPRQGFAMRMLRALARRILHREMVELARLTREAAERPYPHA